MSASWLTLIEVALVFGLAFGWGLNELRILRRDARERRRGRDDDAGEDT